MKEMERVFKSQKTEDEMNTIDRMYKNGNIAVITNISFSSLL